MVKMNGNGLAVKTKEEEQVEKILQPYYHMQQGLTSQPYVDQFALAFNYWLKVPKDKLNAVKEVVNMSMNSIMLHDDIQDNTYLRHGVPVAQSIYGVASTINAGNYVMFMALDRAQSLDHPKATAVFAHHMLELYRGQGMEINWRDNFQCPTEEQYREMANYKSVTTIMVLISLMQLFSDNRDDFSKLVNILGFYCQIQNDYSSLWNKESSEAKGFCEDLNEGKFSFPILHAVNSQPDDRQIINILRLRTRDIEMKRYCMTLIESCGSQKYTLEKLAQLQREMREEVAKFGENPYFAAFLDDLATAADGTPMMDV